MKKHQEQETLLQKNAVYEAEIFDYTTEGSGICKVNGMTVFVPATAVGDRLQLRILKVNKHLAYGKLETLLQPSPDRQASDCEVFGKCGGCVFRHIRYEAELAFKQKRVTDALTRIGGIPAERIFPIVGAAKSDCYRNKAQLPVTLDKEGRVRVGFFAPRSHRVIPLKECQLQNSVFRRATEIFLEWANEYHIPPYDEASHTGILRHLYLRHADRTGELMCCIVANSESLLHEKDLILRMTNGLPSLKTVVLNINTEKTNVITGKESRILWGEGTITDTLCGLKFRISPLSFYQVNRDQAEILYRLAAEFAALNSTETLMDLYCGTGTIGLSMAHQAKRVIGVEIVPQAIADANQNAADNGISNAEFLCADAAQAAEQLAGREIRPDCILVDPPRKGCDSTLLHTIARMSPSRIVYVSCDPATLARDVRILEELGFPVQKAVPIDMFPRTGHVETVCLLSKLFSQGSTAVEFDFESV